MLFGMKKPSCNYSTKTSFEPIRREKRVKAERKEDLSENHGWLANKKYSYWKYELVFVLKSIFRLER